MNWLHDLSYLFGGAVLANAAPHFVSGVMGRPFQTPFAKPPGQGLSSSSVNVLWGFSNLVIAYLLIARVGHFEPRALDQIVAVAVGMLLMGLLSARLFGRFHGGNLSGGEPPRTGQSMSNRGPLNQIGANLTASCFSDVDLSQSTFDDVNLSGASFTNARLADVEIKDADLSNLAISDAKIVGMTIDGILVSDLIRAHRAQSGRQ
jgi:hypothetical protein